MRHSGCGFVRVTHNKVKDRWWVEKRCHILGIGFWFRVSTKFKSKIFANNFVKFEVIK